MKLRIIILLFTLINLSTFAGKRYKFWMPVAQNKFLADVYIGPYLFVDHTPYKSVMMKGVRLGYEFHPRMAVLIEYMAGQQHDVNDQLGTTQSASGQFQFFLNKHGQRFHPYGQVGGGFFEFKDFSKDVLGVAFYAGLGTELNVSPTIKGFIESRYLNLSPMNVGGRNELGVFWGLRARF